VIKELFAFQIKQSGYLISW